MQHGTWARVISGGMIVLLLMQPHGYAAKRSVKPKHHVTVAIGKRPVEKKPVSVQIVSFPDTEWHAVRIIRGGTPSKDQTAGVEPGEQAETAEIVTFGDPDSKPVRVVRGDADRATAVPGQLPPASGTNRELVTFVNPRDRPVTVLRGSIAQSLPGIELFRSARESDLDRVAFAVDGAESSHGTDLRMWRPELNGPQGPMQVSAAAAIDLGGGDRFDMAENRQLGRGYLARMYRRYGNWPDAIAAYNWVRATWMRGSAAGARAAASRSRSSAIAIAYSTTPGLTRQPGTRCFTTPGSSRRSPREVLGNIRRS